MREESASLRGSSGIIGDVNRDRERNKKMIQLRNRDYNAMLLQVLGCHAMLYTGPNFVISCYAV